MGVFKIIELWRPIEDYEGIYEISNKGRVRSCAVSNRWKNSKNLVLLKPRVNKYGYVSISLYKNGKGRTFNIHRLVAKAFIMNPINLPIVNHRDENRTNNSVHNLEWCTYKYNNEYNDRKKRAVAHTDYSKRPKKKGKPILQYTLDGKLLNRWESAKDVEEVKGLGRKNISCCLRGKSKSAYGFLWKYAENNRSDY